MSATESLPSVRFVTVEEGGAPMKAWTFKIAKTGLLAVTVLAVLAIGFALGFRAYRQYLSARVLAVQSPDGIQESMYVRVGGIDQWIQIRGEHRSNPVILFVHGGPGASSIPISSAWQPWEVFHRRSMGPARCWTHLSHDGRFSCGDHDLGADDAGWHRSGRISSSASS